MVSKRRHTNELLTKATPGLYEIFFEIDKKRPEVDIIKGSGYDVLEGPIKKGPRNYYWVERISR